MMTAVGFFALALVVGSFVEYVTHRFYLHSRLRTRATRTHKEHHKVYVRHSIAREFVAFFPPAVPVLWLGFLRSTTAGVAFAAGIAAYVLAVAAVHKWSHEAPSRVFWMDPAVHELHHSGSVRRNFGVVTAFWDRVFGTYRALPARGTTRAASRAQQGGEQDSATP